MKYDILMPSVYDYIDASFAIADYVDGLVDADSALGGWRKRAIPLSEHDVRTLAVLDAMGMLKDVDYEWEAL